ncbi:glycerophosphodiester phosphodiesterase family protein [Marinitenerispora sediminis]|uniref:glycerophosphodiester phosphodiesterase n=1 Tax=Marinitenerispora sediminis TaxID=1931232 RepID=A0A368T9J4_9ACTN|nr:glycerophosphodiester phosphodiesterase family protein [Marinitenerispora sediminis]RCV54886.1 glycerophosphodiester phosphodiesterase [Marinitenerispora sediminis]RCV59251.1 glycerophosphodiester phosphodiesterase [Marinitenerispora sediminis]RCV60287.1 glycerophosphodiester phosphodiesterase [Marinitenerispora sediminis]
MRRNQRKHPVTIISHRGASGHRPEHTLASYELGARHGGDFIEIDLVSTSDGHLIARHENEIGHTTDVAGRPEFADRRTTRTVDGREVTGWFAEDFTLAEIKTLRAVERVPDLRPDNAAHDGRYEIPTMAEIIELAKRLTAELRRPVGVYPETKHPAYHAAAGLALEPPLIALLRETGLAGPEPEVPVFLQSFEADSLRGLAELELPLVQLMHGGAAFDPVATPEGLAEVAGYAQAIGPDKARIIPRDKENDLVEPTSLVADAHAAGLLVHPYTFRSENAHLPASLRSGDDPTANGDFAAEYEAFFELGVDGVFTDHSRHAFLAREIFFGE